MEGQCKHIKQEDFAQFIGRGLEGCSWWLVECHLTGCPECLETLGT